VAKTKQVDNVENQQADVSAETTTESSTNDTAQAGAKEKPFLDRIAEELLAIGGTIGGHTLVPATKVNKNHRVKDTCKRVTEDGVEFAVAEVLRWLDFSNASTTVERIQVCRAAFEAVLSSRPYCGWFDRACEDINFYEVRQRNALTDEDLELLENNRQRNRTNRRDRRCRQYRY